MTITRRTFALSTVAALFGCGGGGGDEPITQTLERNQPVPLTIPTPPTAPRIHKRVGDIPDIDSETAMVVFNGEALCITFNRHILGFEGTAIEVRKWHTGELLASHPWNGGMGCAIVRNGEIHIFGNTNWQNPGNKIIHSVLGVNFAPSTPIDALLMNAPLSPFKFYNTDICADSNGYRMVVETTAGVYFARSTDLNTWTWYGGQLAEGQYIGCPSIDFVGGVHYLTWLQNIGTGGSPMYVTKMVRSFDDCFTFQYGSTLIAPSEDEENNASDVDFVEFAGQVIGVYLNGNQLTYAHTRTFMFPGTLAEMFAGGF